MNSRPQYRHLLGLLLMVLVILTPCMSQVQLPPAVKLQYFSNAGVPLAGGCIFTFMSGTTTPLASYTDSTGGTPNPNPVVLGSDGRPPNDIWLLGQAYRIKLVSPGGVSCSTGTQIWVEDGINPSSASLLSSNNTWTGTNTWQGTSNFNGPTNFNVGFTSLGPNSLGGGGSLSGTYSGSPTFSGTPVFTNGFTVNGSNITVNGIINANGNPPFSVLFPTLVTNLNADLLKGNDWASPAVIGGTSPQNATFTGLHATTSLQLSSGPVFSGTQGTDTKLLSAGTFTGAAGTDICKDANGGATTVGCATSGVSQIATATSSSNCTTDAASYHACSDTLAWSGGGFADTSYIPVCMGQNTITMSADSQQAATLNILSKTATTITVYTQTQRSTPAANYDTIFCIGIHP